MPTAASGACVPQYRPRRGEIGGVGIGSGSDSPPGRRAKGMGTRRTAGTRRAIRPPGPITTEGR